MEERVRQLGGQVRSPSSPGKGTTLRVTLAIRSQPLLNDSLPDGVENQLGQPVQVQLLQNVAAVSIHRVNA